MHALCSAVLLSAVTLTLSQTTVNKRVEADCRKNPDDSSITLTVYIAFNGDPVDKLLALSDDTLVHNIDGTTNEVPCQYTGNLAPGGSIFVTSTVYYDGKPGVNVCGGRKYPPGTTAAQYKWTFEVRERYADGIYTAMDRTYSVVCNLDDAHGSFAIPSSVVYVYGEDGVGAAVRIRPENQMSVLERTGTSTVFGQEVVNGVGIGQQVKLRVQSKVKSTGFRQVNIDHYGVYVFSCDYRTSFTGQRTQFIQQNGCPNAVFSDLASGFRYAQFADANELNYRLFQTETSAFVLARSMPDNNFYYIGCYVGYCYGTEGTEAKCNDYCASNSRRRRSLNDTSEMDRISIAVRITNQEQSATEGRDSAEQTTLIVIASTLSIGVVIAIVALLMIVCLRKRHRAERQWKNISPNSSVTILPVQIGPDRLKAPKL